MSKGNKTILPTVINYPDKRFFLTLHLSKYKISENDVISMRINL